MNKIPEAAVEAARQAVHMEVLDRHMPGIGGSAEHAARLRREAVDYANAALTAALPALRAEVLAPVAALADEWEREGPAWIGARLRAVLADPDAVAK